MCSYFLTFRAFIIRSDIRSYCWVDVHFCTVCCPVHVASPEVTFKQLQYLHTANFRNFLLHTQLYLFLLYHSLYSGDTLTWSLTKRPLPLSASRPFSTRWVISGRQILQFYPPFWQTQTQTGPAAPSPDQLVSEVAATNLGKLLLEIPRSHQLRILSNIWFFIILLLNISLFLSSFVGFQR